VVRRLIGLQQERFGFFILITMLTNCASIMLGLCVSAVTSDVDYASAVGVPLVILSILFGGFYISVDSLPIVANWVPYITTFRWAYQALCINEFKGLRFGCDAPSAEQCILTGEEVLATLDFAGHSTAYPCFGLGMVLLGLLSIAFINLELSTITYTPLGYTGSAYRKHAAHSAEPVSLSPGQQRGQAGGVVAAESPASRPAGAYGKGGYEMVASTGADGEREEQPTLV
jgi:hypothetical protein